MRPGPGDYRDLDTQNDRHIKVVDGALILKNIQKSHEGFYLCKASNGIGGISAVARLAVQGNFYYWFILTLNIIKSPFLSQLPKYHIDYLFLL